MLATRIRHPYFSGLGDEPATLRPEYIRDESKEDNLHFYERVKADRAAGKITKYDEAAILEFNDKESTRSAKDRIEANLALPATNEFLRWWRCDNKESPWYIPGGDATARAACYARNGVVIIGAVAAVWALFKILDEMKG